MVRSRFLKSFRLFAFVVFLCSAVRAFPAEFGILHEVGKGRFREPVDAAVDYRGFFYVLDKGRKSVFLISQHGKIIREVRLPSSIVSPEGIAVKRPGVFYVVDSAKGVVQEVDASGKSLSRFKVSRAKRLVDIGVIGRRVFVLDGRGCRLSIFDPRGKKISVVGSRGSRPGEFRFPYRLAVDGMGRVYVSDVMNGRVQAFDVDGKHLFTVKRFGVSRNEFARPGGVAAYGEGRLLISDLLSGLIYLWDGSTKSLNAVVGADGLLRFSYPSSVTCSKLGDVGVVDRRAGKFVILRQMSR